MDVSLLEHAKDHFECAERAHAKLINRLDFSDKRATRGAWSEFLAAVTTVYAKLEQASKVSAKSRAWFGKRKHEQRQDELLTYLLHARNADRHGIKSVAVASGITARGSKYTTVLTKPDGDLDEVITEAGKPMHLQVLLPGVWLLPVTDRGVTFDPPKVHLGGQLQDDLVASDVTGLTIAYLRQMIEEAEALV
jgi:hypothetical protein